MGRTFYYAVCIVCGKHHKMAECPSVRPSVRLSVPSINSSSVGGGFAAEVWRTPQQISIHSCCCRATCGPRKFWSDCKEVRHISSICSFNTFPLFIAVGSVLTAFLYFGLLAICLKMQRELSLQQRKRNRRNGQTT